LTLRSVVGLGANLGDRLATMRAAARELARSSHLEKTSHVYATAPVGGVRQPEFLNAAALVVHEGSPEELLDLLLAIEVRLGRVRSSGQERWGPRLIDLDFLWAEGVVHASHRLTLPHAELPLRAFALIPLLELVPDAADPRTGQPYVPPPGDVRRTPDLLL
jgi:2-amino-4-hydroxy-6-hydroxymethyldihydropteridine diphosphokinase